MSDSIAVSALPLGAYAANSFPGFTSQTGVVQSLGFYGTTAKYIIGNDLSLLVAQTIATSRSQEITTWFRKGDVYLRLAGGNALYFRMSGDSDIWKCGFVTGFTPGTLVFGQIAGNYTDFGTGTLSSIPGYDGTNTAGQEFTFGCNGFNVYLKFNGVIFFTTTQIANFQIGSVAMSDTAGIGFRDVTVNYPPDNPIFSNLAAVPPVLDMRDFGLSGMKTTGSMGAASTTLNVANAAGFAIGDPIIVGFGGEAGGGAHGTMGVGGAWPFPPAQYANATILQADHSQPANTYGLDLSTGNVWFWGGSAWGQLNAVTEYYSAKAMGLSLKAKITNIVGNAVTLDTPSVVATTGAAIYFNNYDAFDFVMRTAPAGNNYKISIPAGTYAAWGGPALVTTIIPTSRNGWEIFGAGQGTTILLSPKGTLCFTIEPFQCPNCSFHDFTIHGNQGPDGFGFTSPLDNSKNLAAGWLVLDICSGCVVYNVGLIDTFGGVRGDFASFCNCHDCSVVLTTPPKVYLDWYYGWAGCNDCVVQRCTADCLPGYFPAFETFQSTRVSFLQCTTINGSVSTNSSSQYLWKDCRFEMLPGLYVSETQFSWRNPVINCNSNIDSQQGISATPVSGLFLNCDVIQTGYLGGTAGPNGNGIYAFTEIGIDQSTVNVTIQADPPWTQRPPGSPLVGGYFTGPPYTVAGDQQGYIRSDGGTTPGQSGDNFRVIGMRVDATGFPGFRGAITNGSPGGVVQNCVADTIFVTNGAEASANLTLAQWQAQKTKFYEFT